VHGCRSFITDREHGIFEFNVIGGNQMSSQPAAPTPNQSSKPAATQGSRQQSTGLARRTVLPAVSSLLLDPFGLFDDNPFSTLRRLQKEMNRAFPGGTSDVTTAWTPPVEVSYRDGNLVVSAELPGLTDKDVRVEINNDMLTIEGERQVEEEKTEGGVHMTERRYGRFYRAIALPEGADAQQAKAEFQNGVLQITVPVPEAQKNQRQIPIQSSASSDRSGQQKSVGSESASKERAA
jgi:HSP20 family protein